MAVRVAYIVGEFPSRTETFIAREIEGLCRLGAEVTLFSIRGRLDAESRKAARRLGVADLVYRSGGDTAEPAGKEAQKRPGLLRPLRAALKLEHSDLYGMAAAVRNVGTARRWARQVRRRGITHVHAHWATVPTTVALMMQSLTDVKVSFSAHARDIWCHRGPLRGKIARAAAVVTCNEHNRNALRGHCSVRDFEKIRVIYHGTDLRRFGLEAAPTPWERPVVLAAGRLVHKKGFEVLIEACRILLERGVDCECRIVGEGPSEGHLKALIAQAGLEDRVTLAGYVPHEKMRQQYRRATVFVCPSVFTMVGDRDSLPNVLVEAMAMSLPVVATNVSAIPEAVTHMETGILVPDEAPKALATALWRLLTDEPLRRRLGKAARTRAEEKFDAARNVRALLALFQELETEPAAPEAAGEDVD
jgi:glycosyltransferase involved in cell wall biosynthesis